VAIYPIANTANVPERWDIALDGHGFRMEEGTGDLPPGAGLAVRRAHRHRG
jgi:hypothetical protein